ncbi:MAG: zinc ribbon domain-containing protein [Deltaproteobacteria bacterium]|nr:zinc ribbon domain-containing protein [Deltaproteobacteria bacterium]MCB9490090.1 zinc ribbon domain-containing protein [Deltaproteobacteria bacterium]
MSITRCGNCGAPYDEGARVCKYCGSPREDFPRNPLPPAQSPPEKPIAGPSVWRQLRPDWGFEWRTRAELFGLPLVHIAVGRKDGRMRVAKGIVAIGQFALGFITVAQFGIGAIFGLGQFMLGAVVIAQFAGGVAFGLGQFATGFVAIGQFAFGFYVMGQAAIGLESVRSLLGQTPLP